MEFINICFFIIGVFVFAFRPKLTPIYYLLWPTFFIFVSSIFFSLTYEVANDSERYAMNYVWLCACMTIILRFKSYNKTDKLIILLLGILVFYIFLLGYTRGALKLFQSWARGYFCFVPLWLIMKSHNISFDNYRRYIYFALLFEVVLGIIQVSTGMFYPSYTDGEIADNGTVNITGSLTRYNYYADNVSLLVLSAFYLIIMKYKAIGNIDKGICILVVLGIIIVSLSGARTELIALLVSIPLLVLSLFKQKRKIIIKTCIVFGIIISFFGSALSFSSDDFRAQQGENNYFRQLMILDYFSGEKSLTESSTFFFSAVLLNDFFSDPSKMMTGPGKLYTTTSGYGGVVTSKEWMWDCFLALLLCEMGIIGYAFLTLFLYLIIKDTHNIFISLGVLLYLLLVSVTDYGLFHGVSAIYLLFTVVYSQNVNNNRKIIGYIS